MINTIPESNKICKISERPTSRICILTSLLCLASSNKINFGNNNYYYNKNCFNLKTIPSHADVFLAL